MRERASGGETLRVSRRLRDPAPSSVKFQFESQEIINSTVMKLDTRASVVASVFLPTMRYQGRERENVSQRNLRKNHVSRSLTKF